MTSSSRLAAFACAWASLLGCGKGDVPGGPAEWAAFPSIWGYTFELKFTHDDVAYFEHVSGEERIELTVTRKVQPAVARDLIGEKSALFASIFERRRTGYPGQHTKYIDCPEPYRPIRDERDLDSGSWTYFTCFATANRVQGASSDDLAAFRSLYGLLYCDSIETMVELEYFTGRDREDLMSRFLSGVTCDLALRSG